MCLSCVVLAVSGAGSAPAPFSTRAGPLPWPAGAPLGGVLTWTGVAGFILELGGSRIAVDPFVTRPGLLQTMLRPARPDRALVAATFGDLDAVFVSHAHFDHAMDLPALAASAPRVRIHGSATLVELLVRAGVPASRLEVAQDGEPVTTGPFTVRPVASRHGLVPVAHLLDRIEAPRRGLPLTAFRWPRGDVFAYRIEAGDRSFHLQCSAGIDDAALARQQPADVLIACLAARQGTPDYLGRLAGQLRPGLLIPCHHDDFFRPLSQPARPVAQLGWPAFLADAERLRSLYGTRLAAVPRGVPVPI